MVTIFKCCFDTYSQTESNEEFIGFFEKVEDFKAPSSIIGSFSYIEVIVGNSELIQLGISEVNLNDNVYFLNFGLVFEGVIIHKSEEYLTIQTKYEEILVHKSRVYGLTQEYNKFSN